MSTIELAALPGRPPRRRLLPELLPKTLRRQPFSDSMSQLATR